MLYIFFHFCNDSAILRISYGGDIASGGLRRNCIICNFCILNIGSLRYDNKSFYQITADCPVNGLTDCPVNGRIAQKMFEKPVLR